MNGKLTQSQRIELLLTKREDFLKADGSKPAAIGIDFFCGVGGLSLGAMMAGVDVRCAFDSDPHAVETYRWSHPTTKVFKYGIRDIKPSDLGINGSETIRFDGQHCQRFSASGRQAQAPEDQKKLLSRISSHGIFLPIQLNFPL
jgi:DNA (cytosine-5)-methyltransferase 1